MRHPSYIFHNCTIFDGNKILSPDETAVAIRGGAIDAVGADKDVLHTAGPETILIDAGQKLLLPALMDSHTHLSMYAARKLQVDLAPCKSLEEAIEAVKAGVERSAEGEWVIGYGWDKNVWGDVQPTRQMLDTISTRHFISLQSKDWHSLWVNTPVLAICGIDGTSRDPEGGTILREEDGMQPNGILQENACTIVFNQIAPMPLSELYPALKETFSEFHRFGITGVHSVETNYDFANYSRLYSEGKLGLRIFFYFPGVHLRDNTFTEAASYSGNSFLKICGAKLFMDGTLGSQTADMLQPLEGLDHTGIPVLTENDLADYLGRAAEQGLSCAIHAIGDAANRKTLNGFAGIAEISKQKGLRHRIEHAQMLHPDDISRFAEL
ncbi:MAG: amidohydrolase, partial [Calditrichota bacterium]